MTTTQIMYAVVRPDGYGKKQYVRVPFVSALIREPDTPLRYFVLAPEDEPAPAPEPRRNGNFGARPRRNGRPLEPLDE